MPFGILAYYACIWIIFFTYLFLKDMIWHFHNITFATGIEEAEYFILQWIWPIAS